MSYTSGYIFYYKYKKNMMIRGAFTSAFSSSRYFCICYLPPMMVFFLRFSQSQVWEGKVSEDKNKENSNSELKSQKPSEVSAVLNKESLPPLHTNGQVKLTENVSVTKLVDDVKGAKPVILSDKKPVVANGIANGVANAC